MKFNSKEYWESRYFKGGNSGEGSYGRSADIKAGYINSIIEKYNIKTINDLGHGDGNQITLLKGFEKYTGYDVSSTIRNKCILQFKDDSRYTFIDNEVQFKPSDLVMSLDVLYHLTEQEVFEGYVNRLFSLGVYILIYAEDRDKTGNAHVVCRKFTDYITDKYPDFKLIDIADGSHTNVKLYLYKKE